MRGPFFFTAGALALFLTSCGGGGPTLPPPDPPKPPPQAQETAQSHLLLYPVKDASSLLGRAVQVTKDGGWTIAESRAPGCEVAVRKETAAFHTTRKVDMHSMTSLSGGYATFVSIEAKFGKQNTANIDIDNTLILHADTRGACGELIVDTVFVGRGKRTISASAQAAGGVNVNVGVVHADPSVDTGSQQVDSIDWADDEAYGFTYSAVTKAEPLELEVELPSIITEGDTVSIKLTSKQPAYLVIYYLYGDNKADVLWPSAEEPAPQVTPGKPATIPSDAEKKAGIHITASLAKPGEPSRETLVVYGFADRGDFDTLKPSADDHSDDGAAFAAGMTKKLDQVPMSRWSRAVAGYVIQPKKK
jgi:hypothetical protein